MRITYSVGRSAKDNRPQSAQASSFEEYKLAIKALRKKIYILPTDSIETMREKKARLNYIWGALNNETKGRSAINAGTRQVLWLDMDGCSLGAWNTLKGVLSMYCCFCYTTASHEHVTVKNEQRWRIGIMLDSSVTAQLYSELGSCVEQEIMNCYQLLSDEPIKWDHSVYEPSHMVFAPHESAQFLEFEGAVIHVKTILASELTSHSNKADISNFNVVPDDDSSRLTALHNVNRNTFDDMRSALWHPEVLSLAENYPTWVGMGNRLAWFKNTRYEDRAKALWIEWSAKAEKGNEEAALNKWPQLCANRTGYQAIFAIAQKVGWVNPSIKRFSTTRVTVNDFHNTQQVNESLSQPLFKRDKYGQIEATIDNASKAVMHPDFIDIEIRFDAFRDQIMFSPIGSNEWKSFSDADYSRLRIVMEKRGFKAVGRELVRDVVLLAAEENQYDSAIEWLTSLEWDGAKRVDRFCHTHFGTEDSAYTRAVSLYMWTAMAGRVLAPGIKADMVPILVGAQGCGKSSGVAALSPDPASFVEISFAEKDDDLARKMRGRIVVEIGELRGLSTKDLESIKAFVTRTHENWIPKFKEFATQFPRRSLIIGTTNEDEFLADRTGNRRWLPIEVVKVNVDKIKCDALQLWAEAREIFKADGIQYRTAEYLATQIHDKHTIKDAWLEIIERWLDEPDVMTGEKPRARRFLRSGEILQEALNIDPKNISRREQMRIGNVLQSCGYKSVQRRVDGKVARIYESPVATCTNY
ncbi:MULTISPECIES: VapE domain-containing protein [Providencia]|uniref:Virulence-associated protein E n=1 Tax=Providencia alcalifaciens TaxID=126385 RepID=A0A4R3NMC6_9GAMM|nr:VapE domain-containing protein [Providencia alcalifaciens]TCT36732.1 virulence-associated protein E [Providencia alcalifaciens]